MFGFVLLDLSDHVISFSYHHQHIVGIALKGDDAFKYCRNYLRLWKKSENSDLASVQDIQST